jgi:deoxyribonuclease V
MILAVDVTYSGNTATAAGVLFRAWDSDEAAQTLVAEIQNVADYVPGQFYLRELPCIAKVLEQVDVPLDCIVVDGYVTLGETESPGLGWKLWEFLGRATPVIGVAKSEFRGTPEKARLYRGRSARPLFITAAGMPLEQAKARVAQMSGKHRVPDLIETVDRLSRRNRDSATPASRLPRGSEEKR